MATTNFVIGTVIQPDWLNDVNTKTYWTQGQWLTFLALQPTTLACSATVTPNAAVNNTFRIVANQNFTLANPTNLTDGQYINFQIVQDSTGSRLITFGSKFKFVGGLSFSLTTAANAVDFVSCYYDGALDILLVIGQKGFA